MQKKTHLVQFIKNKKRQRIGVVVAIGNEKVGWSLAHKGMDEFEQDLGVHIAAGRAWLGYYAPIPSNIKRVYDNMMYKSTRYWKF